MGHRPLRYIRGLHPLIGMSARHRRRAPVTSCYELQLVTAQRTRK